MLVYFLPPSPASGGFPPRESWDRDPVAQPPEQQPGTEMWGEGVPVALPSAPEWEQEVSAPSGPLEVSTYCQGKLHCVACSAVAAD